jgi:eukaryotic-like serine/threonine-protein kinase
MPAGAHLPPSEVVASGEPAIAEPAHAAIPGMTATEPMAGLPPGFGAPPPDDAASLIGATVGEYVLDEAIGEGGFGAVFRAHHPMIGKVAAVKVLSSAFSGNAELSKRFINEARVVNRINHRNIVDIFAFGQLPDGRQYFVMELLEGKSLGAQLALRGRLPLEEALPIFQAVASAVDAAHEAGVVHRDLKPDNVFLAHDGVNRTIVKLLDFGIAKIEQGPGASNQTRPGQVLGTPSYMSPEQARGRPIDGRSDVYSFGALVHRCLTGRSLFFGLGAVDVALAHINEKPPPMSAACPDLPTGFDAVVLAALQKSPDARPQTLGAVVEGLFAAARAEGLTIPSELGALGSSRLPLGRATGGARPSPSVPAPGEAITREAEPLPVGTLQPFDEGSLSAIPLHRARHSRSLWTGVAVVSVVVVAAAAAVLTPPGDPRPSGPDASPLLSVSGANTLPAGEGSTAAPPPSVLAPLPPFSAAPVTIRVESVPVSSEVFVGPTLVASAGAPFALPRATSSTTLTIRAPGYLPSDVAVLPDRDREVSVTLRKAAAGGTSSAQPPSPGTPTPVPGSGGTGATSPATAKPNRWDFPPDLEPPR